MKRKSIERWQEIDIGRQRQKERKGQEKKKRKVEVKEKGGPDLKKKKGYSGSIRSAATKGYSYGTIVKSPLQIKILHFSPSGGYINYHQKKQSFAIYVVSSRNIRIIICPACSGGSYKRQYKVGFLPQSQLYMYIVAVLRTATINKIIIFFIV